MKKILLLVLFAAVFAGGMQAQTTVNLPDCNDCDPEIATLDCAGVTFNNTEFASGEEYQAAMVVPYTGGNGQLIGGLSVVSTGVTGLTADLMGGNSLATGAGSLVFYVHGTPSGAGTASFDITFGGQTCTADLVLAEATSNAFSIGEVCPLMMNIKDVGATPATLVTGQTPMIFITENGEMWGQGGNRYRMLGYPALTEDDPSVDINTPEVTAEISAPSPLAAVYRQGLTKTWKSVTWDLYGALALAEDGTIWAWGGAVTAVNQASWDRAQHGIIPVGQTAFNAWEIEPPVGLSGFSQLYQSVDQVAWARGNDGFLYSWGQASANALANNGSTSTLRTPTRADRIPHQILDDKFAVIPAGNAGYGVVFIDVNGDVYNYGRDVHTSSYSYVAPVQLTFPTPGVKAVKLSGANSGGTGHIMALGDNGKTYFMVATSSTTGSWPNATQRAYLNITPTTQPINTWVEFDPTGSPETYKDITLGYTSTTAFAVTTGGDLAHCRISNGGANGQIVLTGYNIETVTGSQDHMLFFQTTNGMTYGYQAATVPLVNVSTWPHDGATYGIGLQPEAPRHGPWVMNCYVNPTGVNNVTGN